MSVLLRGVEGAFDRLMGLQGPVRPYEVRRDVPVSMPDGVALLGDHYRPTDQAGPAPVVLIRTPYGRGLLSNLVFAMPLARRGFQVFVQSTRGTFGSGGQFRPATTEREDGLATLKWLRAQPWCDGRVATTGGSYLGHTQWAIAAHADPPLVCMSPAITASRFSSAFYEHGVPQVQTALSWTAAIGRQERVLLGGPIPNPLAHRRLLRALRRSPLQAADVEVAGAPVAFWRDMIGHAEPGDDYWATRSDHTPSEPAAMPPVNMVTGWWDLFVAAQLADFTMLQDAGVPARLEVGPWLHAEPAETRAMIVSDLAWLDHHLRGGPAPEGPPVRVFLQQADSWLTFDRWPPPGVTPNRLHLRGGGLLTPDPASEPGAASRFVYDPADPTPTVGGPMLQPPGKQADNAAIEARPDVLLFTGEPLPRDLDVVGPVTARIQVRTELPYADLFVRLCDVDPDGVSRNVVDGITRIDPRTTPGDHVAAGDDGRLVVDVEMFPTAYRFRRGHRLRVQVAGSAFPRFPRNPGTGEPIGTATSGRPNRLEVAHEPGRPSTITIPVLPGDSARPGSLDTLGAEVDDGPALGV